MCEEAQKNKREKSSRARCKEGRIDLNGKAKGGCADDSEIFERGNGLDVGEIEKTAGGRRRTHACTACLY